MRPNLAQSAPNACVYMGSFYMHGKLSITSKNVQVGHFQKCTNAFEDAVHEKWWQSMEFKRKYSLNWFLAPSPSGFAYKSKDMLNLPHYHIVLIKNFCLLKMRKGDNSRASSFSLDKL